MYDAGLHPFYVGSRTKRLQRLEASPKYGWLIWCSDSPEVFTPDYMSGYAGVAACPLCLADPEELPRQLSRLGFHHRRSSTRTAE
jgi:hypothetical protein